MGKGNQPEPWVHSLEFNSPSSYFEGSDVEVNSFEELRTQIDAVRESGEMLLWRGQENSNWGLHSSLFRALSTEIGADIDWENPPPDIQTRPHHFPTEAEMVAAEKKILAIARGDWRIDALGALEIFARIQHNGGPTRLLDFSFNPYIAAWFATTPGAHTDKHGRIFALAATGPSPNADDSRIFLNAVWGGYDLPWHDWKSKADRKQEHWGDGSLRRFWVPPVYEERISAQNAVFVLDGVPISGMEIQSSFPKSRPSGSNENWKMADLLASGSIYLKLVRAGAANKSLTRNLASSYTLRISPEGKSDIRNELRDLFGYKDSTIFPDVKGLASHLNQMWVDPAKS